MRRLMSFLLWTVLIIGGFVGLARAFVLRWWQLPDEDDPALAASLTPTLWGGDWVLLWRLTSAKHGDLVICDHPTEDDFVIGRLVGEEGERVRVEGSTLHIQGRLQRTERACNDGIVTMTNPHNGEEVSLPCSLETVMGVSHMSARIPQKGNVLKPRDFEITAGPGEAVLLSDNRLFPYDSRDYGAVERATCRETIFFRLVSKDGFQDGENRLEVIR